MNDVIGLIGVVAIGTFPPFSRLDQHRLMIFATVEEQEEVTEGSFEVSQRPSGLVTGVTIERVLLRGCGNAEVSDAVVGVGVECRHQVRQDGRMTRVLVLGGSWFLGRAVVDEAIARGWDVTTFRRGVSGDDAPSVTTVRGDRTNAADLRRLAGAGPWDVVIDTSGFVPREALAISRVLEPVVERYVFVSTVSVYEGWPTKPLTEDSSALDCPPDAGPDFGYDGDPGPSIYGFTKAGCERAVVEVFGSDRSVLLRPGVILGPREYVGRLPWWLRRVERGGRVLAPGHPRRSIQPIDVRDVAKFAVESGVGSVGVFNLTATGQDTMEDFLVACREVVGSDAQFEWITDEDWLVSQGVQQWTELPLWRSYAGAWAVDSSRARAAGLETRNIRATVNDTWSWLQSGDVVVGHERAAEQGIDPVKEREIIAAWNARIGH
ncbi:NAD-dependent epimerase/dehydratase family protein [Amycolatopsis sp. CA-126428]|uniref:NAD-dependent epimerase/dehydratase family protein n=1 Tax=Amycolatopsis sp. CA-126428 TaxID=2073158 RepID=UPI0018EA5791|nr:NAD-dependent epimerase/dehydratase family protein [Amycolatopsis sp. CA-126428]